MSARSRPITRRTPRARRRGGRGTCGRAGCVPGTAANGLGPAAHQRAIASRAASASPARTRATTVRASTVPVTAAARRPTRTLPIRARSVPHPRRPAAPDPQRPPPGHGAEHRQRLRRHQRATVPSRPRITAHRPPARLHSTVRPSQPTVQAARIAASRGSRVHWAPVGAMRVNVAAPGTEAVARAGELPLLGRARELAELMAALEDARAQRGGLVLLTGDPGIGKTRLARALGERAREAGARGAWARGWDG